jgi:hypothetical protein
LRPGESWNYVLVNITFIVVKKNTEVSYLYLHALEYLTAVTSVNPISKDMYHSINCGYVFLITRVINHTIREDVTVSASVSRSVPVSKRTTLYVLRHRMPPYLAL